MHHGCKYIFFVLFFVYNNNKTIEKILSAECRNKILHRELTQNTTIMTRANLYQNTIKQKLLTKHVKNKTWLCNSQVEGQLSQLCNIQLLDLSL